MTMLAHTSWVTQLLIYSRLTTNHLSVYHYLVSNYKSVLPQGYLLHKLLIAHDSDPSTLERLVW
jgi:hypothetical protein